MQVGERWYTVEVEDLTTSPVRVNVEGETFYVEVEGLPMALQATGGGFTPPATSGLTIDRPFQAKVSEKVIRSPMPGRIMAVNVRPGDPVVPGQEVCVVEAMKMEQSIRTPGGGVVKVVHVQPLQQVGTDDPLVELE